MCTHASCSHMLTYTHIHAKKRRQRKRRRERRKRNTRKTKRRRWRVWTRSLLQLKFQRLSLVCLE